MLVHARQQGATPRGRASALGGRPAAAGVPPRASYPAHIHVRGPAPVRAAAAEGGTESLLTGFVFQPFAEVAPQLQFVDSVLSRGDVTTSVARTEYSSRLEGAVNEQTNVEFTMSYVYSALAAFFDRDNVGLPGFAAFFRESSDDERQHAHLLMSQQTRRGGRVMLAPISRPISEFFDETKGDALNGVEMSVAMEKLNFLKLRQLHAVASEEGDAEMTQFIEDHLLRPQAREVKLISDLFSRVRRAGPGHGVIHIDMELQRRYGYGLLQEDYGNADGNGAANGNGVA